MHKGDGDSNKSRNRASMIRRKEFCSAAPFAGHSTRVADRSHDHRSEAEKASLLPWVRVYMVHVGMDM